MEKINIDTIRNVINLINDMFDKKDDFSNINIESLYQYGSKENIVEVLEILNTIKKSNLNKTIKMIKGNQKNRENGQRNNVNKNERYLNEDILKIFYDLTDEDIMSKFKLVELQSMYMCLYSEKPSSGKTKQDIVDVIRNYIYTSNRANAFRL